jgi:carbonic anhydrase
MEIVMRNAIATALALCLASLTPALSATAIEPDRTPDAVLKRLQDGNDRYMKGTSKHERFDFARRVETAANGQRPYSTVLGCSDSRVPTEVVFDQGFAEVFVVRVAGNVCDTTELASIEYGTQYLGTSLVVVLGHSKCGAVEGAVSGKELDGSLPKLMEMIRPAVDNAKHDHPEAQGDALVDAAVDANVFHSMEVLLRNSKIIRSRIAGGQLKVVGAVRDIKSGRVRWLGEHPEQAALLKV